MWFQASFQDRWLSMARHIWQSESQHLLPSQLDLPNLVVVIFCGLHNRKDTSSSSGSSWITSHFWRWWVAFTILPWCAVALSDGLPLWSWITSRMTFPSTSVAGSIIDKAWWFHPCLITLEHAEFSIFVVGEWWERENEFVILCHAEQLQKTLLKDLAYIFVRGSFFGSLNLVRKQRVTLFCTHVGVRNCALLAFRGMSL